MRPLLVLPLLLASSARAELQSPGSLLVFPFADARPGTTCVVTLTNVNPAAGQTLAVEVRSFVDCLETNRTYPLPSNDTLSFTMSQAFPAPGQGFLCAVAKDAFGRAVSANHLIGSVLVLDGNLGLEFQIPAVAFASPLAEGAPTDIDGDDLRDLNGAEYARAPDELLFPRFVGQSTTFRSELVLVNLTGGRAFTAVANLTIWNDDRDVFVAQHTFRCWSRVRLADASGAFSNSFLLSTGHNPSESVLGRENGWFHVDGHVAYSSARTIADPALLGALIEPASYSSASLPFGRGTQDNGDIYPTGVNGDGNGFPGNNGPVIPTHGGIFGG